MIDGLKKDTMINTIINTNKMKRKVTIVLAVLAMTIANSAFSQMADDCAITGSLFVEPAKAKNYTEAIKHYDKVVTECPKYSLATYQLGERMFKHFIDEGDKSMVSKLIKNYELRLQHYPSKTKEGDILGDIAQAMYDNDMGTKEEQFAAFDKAQKQDPDNFTSPKAVYTYFRLAIELQEAGKKDLQDIFELNDILNDKIEGKENDMAAILKQLLEKQENGTNLDKKEEKKLNAVEKNLESYGKIKGSINSLLGQKADCENLIPLYEKQFDEKKGDINWLRVAAGRLNGKDCETPLFVRLVEQLNVLEPSARTLLYLGNIAQKEGNFSKANEYYNQAVDLETNPNKKAEIYYRLAESARKKGSFSTARSFYNKMLDVKPSAGIAYLKIAQMIASSSNSCGATPFDKRAVNWKAAEYADRAARVDASLASNARAAASSYRQRAPSKSDIFNQGMAGKTVSFNCWVGGSVRVPNL